MQQKAVLAGATGLIGKALLPFLLNDTSYSSVTVLVRRSTGLTHPKLQERIVDFARLAELDLDFNGADVYCSLGTTIKKAGSQAAFRKVDYTYPFELAKIAKSRGAQQFLIVTAIGSAVDSKIFYSRVKGEIEADLKQLGLPSLHIFRPSLLLGNREEFRAGERFWTHASKFLLPLFQGPLRRYRPIHDAVVAKAMLLAAKKDLAGVHTYESEQITQLLTVSSLP